MKRTAFTLLSIGAAALLATGCSSSKSEPELGEEVVVQFGDGEASIYLHNVDIQETEAGTEITADVASDMPDVYTFRATVQGPEAFETLVDNGAEVSHQVVMNERELNIEFLRPLWERSESVGFLDADVMDSWLQERIDNGSADCGELPARFRDMPLQYMTTAVLEHLSANHGVELNLTKMQRILCAQAADAPEGNGLNYPKGLDGWQALLDGEYLPPNLQEELPAFEQASKGSTDMQPKNNCARDSASKALAATYDTQTLGNGTTNLDLTCGDAVLEVDANCCVDVGFDANSFGTMRKAATSGHPFCRGVAGDSGPTQYAEFRFAGHANICPSAPNSCWGDGHHDIAKPFSCTFSGYSNEAEYPFEANFGGGEIRKSGVAGWNYLQFVVRTCYEPGTEEDTLYAHISSVDTNRPDKLICWHDSIADCYCGSGP